MGNARVPSFWLYYGIKYYGSHQIGGDAYARCKICHEELPVVKMRRHYLTYHTAIYNEYRNKVMEMRRIEVVE